MVYLSGEEPEEDSCEVLVDLGQHCGKPITSVVEEKWTPARDRIDCCNDCAESFVRQGYVKVKGESAPSFPSY